jgi:GT2 family glycosyltransferase
MRDRVTGSIVIYKNNYAILGEAITSFLNSTENSTLYLVDNSPVRIEEAFIKHPRIKYIFNNRNLGFGAGHNIALREVLANGNSKYHVVLNPDVYFDNTVISKLFHFAEENEKIGLIMPKVLYPDGRLQPLCRLLPSPFTLFCRRFLNFTPALVERLNHWYEMRFSGYNKVMDVPFLSGCFMFLRVEALRSIGLFDERIFLYTEDVDLSRRIHREYRTVFFPESTIYHYHQKGSYKNTAILMQHVRSTITYFNKWGWFSDAERELINENILLKFSE